jgi:hypothetical protein
VCCAGTKRRAGGALNLEAFARKPSQGRQLEGVSDEAFPIHRKRNSASALRSQRRGFRDGNLQHGRGLASNFLSLASSLRRSQRARGHEDERTGRREFAAARFGQQSVRALAGSRRKSVAATGRAGDCFTRRRQSAKAKAGHPERRGKMRWRFNGTLRVAAGKSLTTCSIARASCATSADWIPSISCCDVSLGGHNVKNDIMAFGVASVCS